jgi:nucleoside-diphosphate-sugar epimerase
MQPKVWLITVVTRFLGSNLLKALLKLDQQVVGLDNFSTGYRRNLKKATILFIGISEQGRYDTRSLTSAKQRNYWATIRTPSYRGVE